MLVTQTNGLGQSVKKGSIWCLGGQTGIDFRYDPPTVSYDFGKFESGISTRNSAISDEHGDLLFYTDGDTVWNKNHEIMVNGVQLTSKRVRSPLSSVIVPYPGDGQLYFIFIANPSDELQVNEGLHYAVVDMSKNQGLGEVTQKQIKLLNPVAPMLSVAPHADDQSLWVISHGTGDTKFYAFKISMTGVSPPVISDVGRVYDYNTYHMKVSPDGSKLATAHLGFADLYDFNSNTGKVSNPRSLGGIGASGVEFSPNSELLYVACYTSNIFQFDVSVGELTDILISGIEVGQSSTSAFSEIQLAYNGKIYAGFSSGQISNFLVSIEAPNIKGVGCNFNEQGLRLFPYAFVNRMPVAVQSFYRDSPSLPVSVACKGVPVTLSVTSLGYADSLAWDIGNGFGSYQAFPNGKIRRVTFTETGTYTIVVRRYVGSIYRDIVGSLTVIEKPYIELGVDTTLCDGQKLFLDAGNHLSYNWNTGNVSQFLEINSEGAYSVEVSNGVCENADTIAVSFIQYPIVNLGEDKVVCDSYEARLEVDNDSRYKFLWSNGSDLSNIVVEETGQYSVRVSNQHCQVTDNILVTFGTIGNINDSLYTTTFGEPLLLKSRATPVDRWVWDFGDGSVQETDTPIVDHLFKTAGEYNGHIFLSNLYGCTGETTIKVKVPFHLFVPNVITPNNDELNDSFTIEYNGDRMISTKIVNRWGDLVYESLGTPKWKAEGSPTGVYYYSIKVYEVTIDGWLRIIR